MAVVKGKIFHHNGSLEGGYKALRAQGMLKRRLKKMLTDVGFHPGKVEIEIVTDRSFPHAPDALALELTVQLFPELPCRAPAAEGAPAQALAEGAALAAAE